LKNNDIQYPEGSILCHTNFDFGVFHIHIYVWVIQYVFRIMYFGTSGLLCGYDRGSCLANKYIHHFLHLHRVPKKCDHIFDDKLN